MESPLLDCAYRVKRLPCLHERTIRLSALLNREGNVIGKLLTVVVPMYNVENYIEKCLDSFVVPEIMDFLDVLIINDRTPDGSRKKAAVYESKYPHVFRIVDKENGGHGSVINRGIEEANGAYFKVVDGDDWVDDAAGRHSKEVEELCPGIVYGVYYPFEKVADQIFMKTDYQIMPDMVYQNLNYTDIILEIYRTSLLKSGIHENRGRKRGSVGKDTDTEYGLIAVNIHNYSEDMKNIRVAGTAGEDAIDEVADSLSGTLDGMKISAGGNLLRDEKTIRDIPDCDGEVLVEKCRVSHYNDIGLELEKARDMGRPVIGCIVFE